MREILFRGKRVDDGEWVYGDVSFNRKGEPAIRYWPTAENKTYQVEFVDPSTVGQYTGLKDKNGKRIFEGDVILVDNGQGSHTFAVKCGEFKPATFYSMIEAFYGFTPKEYMVGFYGENVNGCGSVLLGQNNHTRIIGTIHDNPEPPKEVEHETDRR